MANGSRRFGGGSNRRLARFNASGDVQWSRVSQSCSGWDRVEEMVATGDGAVLAVGGPMALRVDPSDVLDGWLGRIASDGSLQWSEHYVREGFNRPEALAATTDGGFVLGGRTDAGGTSELPAQAVGTDASGDLKWSANSRTRPSTVGFTG